MSGRPRFLIVGGDGLLGRSLAESLADAGEVITTTRRHNPSGQVSRIKSGAPTRSPESHHEIPLDLSGDAASWELPKEIAVAWLLAAVTSQAACRDGPAATRPINVDQTLALFRRLREQGAFVVFPSTNLVFDGSMPCVPTDAPRAPQTEYGRQKAAVEDALAASGEPSAIVRLTKVVPPGFPLLREWRNALESGRAIRPARDLRMAPIPLDAAVVTLREVGLRQMAGVTQVSADRDISWEDAGQWIAESLGVPELVRAAPAADLGLTLEWLPEHTTLDTARIARELGLSIAHPRSTILTAAGCDSARPR